MVADLDPQLLLLETWQLELDDVPVVGLVDVGGRQELGGQARVLEDLRRKRRSIESSSWKGAHLMMVMVTPPRRA